MCTLKRILQMTLYQKVKDNPKTFLSLTSLTWTEFESFVPFFEDALDQSQQERYQSNPKRKRKPGGGAKATLKTSEEKFFFILYYKKTYPLQEVLGAEFSISQGRANIWIHKLTPILKTALEHGGYLPERCPENVEGKLNNSLHLEFALDGTERGRQRPKDPEDRKKYYSGKKKKYTIKNNVLIDIHQRCIIYFSQTFEGKKHDKKICDEEPITFPDGSVLYLDLGYISYSPEGATIYQPRKKPRGGKRTEEDKIFNKNISCVRIIVEHVISGIKRFRIVKDIYRNTKKNFKDLIMEIACGLHNMRSHFRNQKEPMAIAYSE